MLCGKKFNKEFMFKHNRLFTNEQKNILKSTFLKDSKIDCINYFKKLYTSFPTLSYCNCNCNCNDKYYEEYDDDDEVEFVKKENNRIKNYKDKSTNTDTIIDSDSDNYINDMKLLIGRKNKCQRKLINSIQKNNANYDENISLTDLIKKQNIHKELKENIENKTDFEFV